MLSIKLKLVVILSVIILIDCNAQFSLNPAENARSGSVQYIYSLDKITSPVEYTIEGTPYLTDTYLKSHVYSHKGNFSDIDMRYNIFYERMEFKEKDLLYAIDPDSKIKKIVLDAQTFVVDNYELKGKTAPAYFLRLDSGRVTLMTKMRIIFKDRQQGKPIEDDIPAKYSRMQDINYIKLGDRSLIKVRSIKKLIDELPDRKQEMEDFAKKEKISANKAEELTKFIQYYNSLK